MNIAKDLFTSFGQAVVVIYGQSLANAILKYHHMDMFSA